jgi:ABC-type transport system substrate-binding protein
MTAWKPVWTLVPGVPIGRRSPRKRGPYSTPNHKLLADAGVKLPIKVEFLTYNSPRGYNPAGPDLATAIQGYLGKIGVEAEIRKVDMGANLATIRSGKYPGIFMVGWTGDNGDPDNFVGELFNSKSIPSPTRTVFGYPANKSALAAETGSHARDAVRMPTIS